MSANEVEGFLSRLDFFAGLDPESIAFLATTARAVRLEAGTVLFRHGEEAVSFYLIVSGRVIVDIPAIEGPNIEIQHLGDGELLGWSWLISPYKWSFQARALEQTEVLEFDGQRVREQCEADPAFGYDMCKRFSALMAARLEAARRVLMDQWSPPGFA